MARPKGSKNATPEQIKKFFRLIDRGVSPGQAGRLVGMSAQWGSKMRHGYDLNERVPTSDSIPKPKTYAELDGGVKDTLKDFSLFQKTFFAMDRVPWQEDAANRVVERLLDPAERSYGVINLPPGAGKSTIFTFHIPVWLLCGGGIEDPSRGRALRLLLGHNKQTMANYYVRRLKTFFELYTTTWYEHKLGRKAELSPVAAFGRFKPKVAEGEESMWRQDAILIAQMEDIAMYEKEPSVQAVAREAAFIGSRVDYYVWDDVVTQENSGTVEASEKMEKWCEDVVESRLEPGGVGVLVGQRLSNLDLYRNRLDATYHDEAGDEQELYFHVIYPAHNDQTCDGTHRQWDAREDGCLLDAKRLTWSDLLRAQSKSGYRTVYQQEDSNPDEILIQPAWLDGGMDQFGQDVPGCYDRDRGFFEWPAASHNFIDYVTVDPSVSNMWAIEWWSVDPSPPHFRYLIYGLRKKMQAGSFIDWDQTEGKHVGVMEELQQKSCELGHPIKVWIVEQNAAHKYLFQFEHFRTWKRKWALVNIWDHQTQKNKADSEFGVEAALPSVYRAGLKRFPRRKGTEGLVYLRDKRHELTTYPAARTDDTVMADWFGEFNMPRILRLQRTYADWNVRDDTWRMPKYLRDRQEDVWPEEVAV